MREIKLFEDKTRKPFQVGDLFSLSSSNAHIVSHVLRLKPGGSVKVIDGQGGWIEVLLKKVGRDCEVEVASLGRADAPSLEISLLQSPPKGEAFDQIIRQSVEWGISRIFLLESEYCVRKVKEKTVERVRKHAIEALRQSGNLFLPEIRRIEWADLNPREEALKILLDEAETKKQLKDFAPDARPGGKIYLAIGPEGGWSEGDRKEWAKLGFESLSLASPVLKSDTAAVSAIAIVRTLFADP